MIFIDIYRGVSCVDKIITTSGNIYKCKHRVQPDYFFFFFLSAASSEMMKAEV